MAERRFVADCPLRVICMAVVYDAFGDCVSAPVQLQRYEQLKAELCAQRERERADQVQAAREDSLWALEPR